MRGDGNLANIRVDVGYTIHDGAEIKFRSPVDCSAITGLIVYYPGADGNIVSKVFALADAHGNNVGDIDHLFAENVVVKVILDVTKGMAFVQNADTNAYLEAQLASKAPAGYGMGAQAKPITNPDEATKGGIYRIYSQTDNMPFNFMLLLSMPYYDDWVQFATQWTTGVMAVRHHTASAGWSEWEYINSPMKTGVEYRTTERIDDKAVYKKNVSGAIQYRLDGETTWNSYSGVVGARPNNWVPSASQVSGQTDYVVANGTSGVWSYWKLNSGLCIAMGTPTVTWGTYTSLTTGQYRSTAAMDLTGIFTSVMGGTVNNAHRFVNCFVIPSGATSAELWATSAASAATSNFITKMNVVLFGKWK